MSTTNTRRAVELEFEKREHVRSCVGLPAVIRVGDKDYSARIANIAVEGAMIESSATLHLGMSLSLRCGSIATDGVVVWTSDGQTGVNFTYPLSDRELAEQLSRTAAIASRRHLNRSS